MTRFERIGLMCSFYILFKVLKQLFSGVFSGFPRFCFNIFLDPNMVCLAIILYACYDVSRRDEV